MTHGCLEIRTKGERRKVFLHTYHTGMMIPEAVQRAFAVRAKQVDYFLGFLPKRKRKEASILPALMESFRRCNTTEVFGYAPSAAALIITAVPGLLEPLPPAFLKDLPPGWSGMDSPYRLTVAEHEWVLLGEEGKECLRTNPTEELARQLIAMKKGLVV